MENFTEVPAKPEITYKDLKSDNGLQNLVLYYQNLFDIEENCNYYNITDYQHAKRKFVKYYLNNRVLWSSGCVKQHNIFLEKISNGK